MSRLEFGARALYLVAWLGLALSGAVSVGPAQSAEKPPEDPVSVFYPVGDCESAVLEIELWDRKLDAWRPHPAHARIMADTCQLEDAGLLLNEIRVRCTDLSNPARSSPWITGAQVYEPAGAPGCRAPEIDMQRRRNPRILLSEPSAEVPVQSTTRVAPVGGRVRLAHDWVVLLDSSFDQESTGILIEALLELVGRDDEMLGPMRLGAVGFDGHLGSAIPPGGGMLTLSDDRDRMRSQLVSMRGPERPPGTHGFAAGIEVALATLTETDAAADRRTLLALVNGLAEFPFGEAAGLLPAHRSEVLAAVEHGVRAGVALEILVIGRSERGLAELAQHVGERIQAGGRGGELRVLDGPGVLAGVLPRIQNVSLLEVRVENLTTGIIADPLEWDRAGRFRGRIPLRNGRNLLRVRARLSTGEDIVADFERHFDPRALREQLRSAERERMQRAREQATGIVTIDAEERENVPSQ